MAINRSGVTLKTARNLSFDSEAFQKLVSTEVLVGIPEETTTRKNLEGSEGMAVTNASIAYIQDNGAPEMNIPARPFMREGIDNARVSIVQQLDRGVSAALRGDEVGVDRAFHGAGLAAQRGIRNKIKEGIPPPLSERTLKERAARGRTGAVLELEARARGEAPSIDFATPLMDTGEMLQSIKYAIRNRSERQ